MSHGESKVELSQARLKHVCQVEQKGKRLSGRETHLHASTLPPPPLSSLRLTSLTLSFPSQTLSDTATVSTTLTGALLLSHSVTFIFAP